MMKLLRMRSPLVLTQLSIALAVASGHVSAAKPALEEVVVTAQKRTELLSDTPLSIQAVSGDAMARENILEMDDLVAQMTNVTLSSASGPQFMTMRGLGTGVANSAAEQSVGMFIDGIYVSRGYQFNAPFLDIERVEVLKGPQGILAGKNAVAGAVVIHTKRPTAETEGFVRGGYEFQNGSEFVEAAISGALTDNFFVRVTGQTTSNGGWLDKTTRESSDGVILQGEEDQNTTEIDVLRLSAVWDFSDTLTLFGKVEGSSRDILGEHFGTRAIQPGASTTPGGNIEDNFRSRDPNFDYITNGVASNGRTLKVSDNGLSIEATNGTPFISVDAQAAVFQFDKDLDGLGTLTGISGYSTYKHSQLLSNGMVPVDWIQFKADEGNGGDELDQFTQEFRLVSPGGETIDYVVGLFFMDRTIEVDGAQIFVALSELGIGEGTDAIITQIFKEQTKTYSAFGQLTWNIGETLRLNTGVRYTYETKDRLKHSVESPFLNPLLNNNPIGDAILAQFGTVPFDESDVEVPEIEDTTIDPSASLQWDVSDGTMLYASYTEATKAGGFNAQALAEKGSAYRPESAISYEIGAKSFLFDNRLSLNAAIFHSKFTDLQVSSFDSSGAGALIFQNAATATSEGVELDFRLAATSELEIGGAVAYLDATYDDFPGAACSAGSSKESDCDTSTNTRNAAGDKLRLAADLSGNLYADYRWGIGSGLVLGFRTEVTYSDDYYFTAENDPYGQQDAFTKVNVLLELADESNQWSVSLLGKNITDETTANYGGGAPFFVGAYWSNVDKPRQLFLNARYNFNL
ncbi:TonB-dependent receptor [Spongiibacter sp. KMU-166]|uniref:TonB-dependent receptor n=1 Tax=Spongiibacter thalassae TaxID=2721624 RepID=A0ABX1GJN4_9GAMM|nr:TonB-dependent receptor [Spongiibacter thalassae]NKI18682.1 TonB-dependent receptor [Spongiibacter thalassae]